MRPSFVHHACVVPLCLKSQFIIHTPNEREVDNGVMIVQSLAQRDMPINFSVDREREVRALPILSPARARAHARTHARTQSHSLMITTDMAFECDENAIQPTYHKCICRPVGRVPC